MTPEDFREAQLQRRVRKLKQLLGISRAKTAETRGQLRATKKDLRHAKQQIRLMEALTVTEWCPHCERECTMVWAKDEGYKAFCPACGNRLMLCDECQHRRADGGYTGDCDYDSDTDSCRFNTNGGGNQ